MRGEALTAMLKAKKTDATISKNIACRETLELRKNRWKYAD